MINWLTPPSKLSTWFMDAPFSSESSKSFFLKRVFFSSSVARSGGGNLALYKNISNYHKNACWNSNCKILNEIFSDSNVVSLNRKILFSVPDEWIQIKMCLFWQFCTLIILYKLDILIDKNMMNRAWNYNDFLSEIFSFRERISDQNKGGVL